MRIGIDARFFGPHAKGLGRYTQKLVEWLEKTDTQNDYVIFLRRENFYEFLPQNPRFRKVLADYRWYTLAEQIFFPFVIRRQKVDLMHFPHFNVPIFYFRPFVVTIHDLILQHFSTRRASTLGWLKYWLKNLAYKIIIHSALKRAKKIITVSQYVKREIIKYFKIMPDKIALTYEGAADGMNDGQAPDFKKYAITKPFLLYVGNAYPHKNLERLVEGFEILTKKYNQDLQLVLVGGNDYFFQRLEKEKPAERIVFAGFVSEDELPSFYKSAAVYVFPSLCEGFGLPPLEAMSYGLPVVSSDATCLPEILGEAAVYFNPLEPQTMAEKINLVLTDEKLRRDLIAAGRERIKRFSWKKMAEDLLVIYEN